MNKAEILGLLPCPFCVGDAQMGGKEAMTFKLFQTGLGSRRKALPWLTKPLLRKAVFRGSDQIDGQNQPYLNQYLRVGAQNYLAADRRFNSASTASRIKSDRFSPSASAASMRASVPPGKRAGVCSSLILGRPTGAAIVDITF